MRIEIESIDHKDQRYSTCGDWFVRREAVLVKEGGKTITKMVDVLHVKVSKLPDPRFEQLIAIHELIEVFLCQQAGITEEQVDQFDKEFEKNRGADNQLEPGDDAKSPYSKQHGVASGVERMLAALLGVNWNDYADELEKLP